MEENRSLPTSWAKKDRWVLSYSAARSQVRMVGNFVCVCKVFFVRSQSKSVITITIMQPAYIGHSHTYKINLSWPKPWVRLHCNYYKLKMNMYVLHYYWYIDMGVAFCLHDEITRETCRQVLTISTFTSLSISLDQSIANSKDPVMWSSILHGCGSQKMSLWCLISISLSNSMLQDKNEPGSR